MRQFGTSEIGKGSAFIFGEGGSCEPSAECHSRVAHRSMSFEIIPGTDFPYPQQGRSSLERERGRP
eukprot:scaffold186877_cov32-Tisochrysis_lutea.AAC.1